VPARPTTGSRPAAPAASRACPDRNGPVTGCIHHARAATGRQELKISWSARIRKRKQQQFPAAPIRLEPPGVR
jgi:hypothetical protein